MIAGFLLLAEVENRSVPVPESVNDVSNLIGFLFQVELLALRGCGVSEWVTGVPVSNIRKGFLEYQSQIFEWQIILFQFRAVSDRTRYYYNYTANGIVACTYFYS